MRSHDAVAAPPATSGKLAAWINRNGPVLAIFVARVRRCGRSPCARCDVPGLHPAEPVGDRRQDRRVLAAAAGERIRHLAGDPARLRAQRRHRHSARDRGGLFAHLRARRVSVHGLAADHSEGRAGADPGDLARLRHHAEGDGGLSDLVLSHRDQFRDRHALGREGDDLSGAIHGRERAHDLPQDPAAEGAALDLRRPQGRHRPGGGGRDRRRIHRRRSTAWAICSSSPRSGSTRRSCSPPWSCCSLLGVLLFNAVAFAERIALPWSRVATDVAE